MRHVMTRRRHGTATICAMSALALLLALAFAAGFAGCGSNGQQAATTTTTASTLQHGVLSRTTTAARPHHHCWGLGAAPSL